MIINERGIQNKYVLNIQKIKNFLAAHPENNIFWLIQLSKVEDFKR